jgi:mono/diheme cytochrome c family protein
MNAWKYLKTRKTAAVSYVIAAFFLVLNCQNAEAQSQSWPVPPEAASLKNPIASDPETLENAKTLYMNYCSPCHGERGKGDGFAGEKLNPKPAVHASAFVQNETDGTLYYKMSEGRKVMPAYKAVLTEKERWELVNYIRTLASVGKE